MDTLGCKWPGVTVTVLCKPSGMYTPSLEKGNLASKPPTKFSTCKMFKNCYCKDMSLPLFVAHLGGGKQGKYRSWISYKKTLSYKMHQLTIALGEGLKAKRKGAEKRPGFQLRWQPP